MTTGRAERDRLRRLAEADERLRAAEAGVQGPPPSVVPAGQPDPRTTLEGFIRWTWPGFSWNWHHQTMCRHIDLWVAGVIKRLMIFAPRRHSKSELISRRLPAYLFGRDPAEQMMSSSHTVRLARRMSRDVQRIIGSPRYRSLFPHTRLPESGVARERPGEVLPMRTALEWETAQGGLYLGMGVGTGSTGVGFRMGIVDDVFKSREDAMSPTIRAKVWDWYQGDFVTGQAPGASILITNTRYHTQDLPGRLLQLAKEDPKADQWVCLTFAGIKEAA